MDDHIDGIKEDRLRWDRWCWTWLNEMRRLLSSAMISPFGKGVRRRILTCVGDIGELIGKAIRSLRLSVTLVNPFLIRIYTMNLTS